MRKDERKLGDELKRLFANEQSSEAFIQSKIKRYWQTEIDAVVSERISSVSYKSGIVTIGVTSAPLRNQLLQNREILIYKMNKYLGSEQVTEIKLL